MRIADLAVPTGPIAPPRRYHHMIAGLESGRFRHDRPDLVNDAGNFMSNVMGVGMSAYFRKYPSMSCTSERHMPHAFTLTRISSG